MTNGDTPVDPPMKLDTYLHTLEKLYVQAITATDIAEPSQLKKMGGVFTLAGRDATTLRKDGIFARDRIELWTLARNRWNHQYEKKIRQLIDQGHHPYVAVKKVLKAEPNDPWIAFRLSGVSTFEGRNAWTWVYPYASFRQYVRRGAAVMTNTFQSYFALAHLGITGINSNEDWRKRFYDSIVFGERMAPVAQGLEALGATRQEQLRMRDLSRHQPLPQLSQIESTQGTVRPSSARLKSPDSRATASRGTDGSKPTSGERMGTQPSTPAGRRIRQSSGASGSAKPERPPTTRTHSRKKPRSPRPKKGGNESGGKRGDRTGDENGGGPYLTKDQQRRSGIRFNHEIGERIQTEMARVRLHGKKPRQMIPIFEGMGLRRQGRGSEGYEWVDSKGRTWYAWDPAGKSGPAHWHKYHIDSRGNYYGLNDRGYIIAAGGKNNIRLSQAHIRAGKGR